MARTVAAPERPALGQTVVEARGVGVTLGGTRILSGIDFEVRAGELLAIIGPNGAGKSTLLGALAGDHGYEGSVRIAGRELTGYSHRELALRRAVLRQSNSISFPFDVVDVVKMGRAPWRSITSVEEDDRIIVEELLRSDTLQFAERPFTSLSGGERARVSLARAMAQRTPVLMLDEPTAALDVNYQEQVLAVARRYARQGNAVVVVLHDLAAAAAYADTVMLLSDGGQLATGSPVDVMRSERLSEVYGHPVRVIREEGGGLHVVPVRFADEAPVPHVPASHVGSAPVSGSATLHAAAPASESRTPGEVLR